MFSFKLLLLTSSRLNHTVFGLHDLLLAKENLDNLDHIDLKNLQPLGRMHNISVESVQGIAVTWTLPSVSKDLICHYNVHYIHDQL